MWGVPLDPQIVGKRFGRVVVISDHLRTRYGHVLCEFDCDCGNRGLATASCLHRGAVVSCGCKKVERFRELGRIWGLKHLRRT